VAVLVSPSEIKLRYEARLQFTKDIDKCTNNITEYEAILLGLHNLRAVGVQTCILIIDSKVVCSQIEEECITREPTLKNYLALVRRMENYFKGFTVEYIERSKNSKADELAKGAAHSTRLTTDIFFQVIEDALMKTVEPKPKISQKKGHVNPIRTTSGSFRSQRKTFGKPCSDHNFRTSREVIFDTSGGISSRRETLLQAASECSSGKCLQPAP
jgi:ribonuclease HI